MKKIPDEIYYNMSHEETMKMFAEVNTKVLSIGMKDVKKIYSDADIDPVLLAFEFQEYMQENREYYDKLFNKFAWKYLKANDLLK